ncbi:MAG: Phosphohistidine phosphatase SixA [Deltaproteobacteria bacterium]|nr:Phosphohistidine phosphatase SixA [Deltaproteobacteria bacterium]
MQLFLIRHAIAEEAISGQEDARRELTEDGEKKLKQAVRGMRELGISFHRVLTSPWQRAARTAELLHSICATPPIMTDLLCQPPRAELLSQITELAEDTAIVGHQPWLGELASWLAFGDTRHGEALVIQKSGVVWLEGKVVPHGMTVRALLPPKVLRALA